MDWNRYAYVHYNPINYVDPSGHRGEINENGTLRFFHNYQSIYQVDIDTYQSTAQYDAFFYTPCGGNACGLAAPDVPLDIFQQLIDAANMNDSGYSEYLGIQPSKLVALYERVFGVENVTAYENLTMDQLFDLLLSSNQVIVDIMANEYGIGVSDTYAHFARVLGMDNTSHTIYIANTLYSSVNVNQTDFVWETSYDDFRNAWNNPENRAENQPRFGDYNVIPETVYFWAVVIRVNGN